MIKWCSKCGRCSLPRMLRSIPLMPRANGLGWGRRPSSGAKWLSMPMDLVVRNLLYTSAEGIPQRP